MTSPATARPLAVHPLRAIGFALIGFTCWAISDALNKIQIGMNVPNYQMMLINGCSGLFMVGLLTWLRSGHEKLKPKRLSRLLAYGLTLPVNYCIILVALRHLPLTDFYAISFAAPLCTATLSAIFLRERLDIRKLAAIIAGFGGVLVAVNPAHMFDNHAAGISIIAATVAMLIFSAQQLIMRWLSQREAHECLAFWPRLSTITAGIIAMLIFGYHPVPPLALFYNIAGGSIGGFGWLCMAIAYKNASAATVAPFHYSQIITGAVIGYVVWKDVPTWHVVAGVIIIIASGIYIINHTRKKAMTIEVEI